MAESSEVACYILMCINKKRRPCFCRAFHGWDTSFEHCFVQPPTVWLCTSVEYGFFPEPLKILEEKYSSALKNPEINKLKLFLIAMGGEKDIAYQYGKNLNAVLDKYGIKYKTADYPAGHTFTTWRHNLYEFAPLLFR